MIRGYWGIGIENVKAGCNVGTLFRSAMNFNADFIFVIGNRYRHQRSNTVKAQNHIPFFEFEDIEHFKKTIPLNCLLVGIEIIKEAKNIINFSHPERVVYVLGAEDYGLSEKMRKICNDIIYIPSHFCLNVSVAGAIVMYDRFLKLENKTRLQIK